MSTVLSEKRLLISSLLSKDLQKEVDTLSKKGICAIALLITNTALNAIKDLEQGHYKKFDANPGDGGCQIRALELRQLVKDYSLLEECDSLKKKISKIKSFVTKQSQAKEQKNCLIQNFLQSNSVQNKHLFEGLKVSKEMEYFLHCYLSAVLRTPYRAQEDGVIRTKSDMSKLSKLSKNIGCLSSNFRNKIVEENQKQLSILSLEAIHASSKKITSLKNKEKELMVTMLSEDHRHLFSPDEKKYELKAFGCLFYEVKAVLTCLKEERGIICLKSITKEKKPIYIFLQSKEAGKEFEVLLHDESISLDPTTLIVVFEAVMHVGEQEIIKCLRGHGFSKMVLIQAAQQSPYESGLSIDDIKNPEAVREITDYLSIGIESFFTMDHVYLNSLQKELDLKEGNS